jgi:Domain of unknown function (DUF5668)
MPGPIEPRCSCAHCRIRALMAPVILITLGVLFLIAEYSPYGFGRLWPILLIVVGVMAVLQSTASHDGHTGS